MSYIQHIGTANPAHSLTQEAFAKSYASMTDDTAVQRKIKFIAARSAINKRHCIEPDIQKLLTYTLQEKLALYHTHALALAKKAVENNPSYAQHSKKITDIIFVSCTGMQAPGVEIDLIQSLGLSLGVRRYNVTFMGCYATLTALRIAKDICTSPNRVVLLISVELCTLHFQHQFVDDYLLSNSLFADGAASAIITSEPYNAIYELLDFESRLLPTSKNEMSWKIAPSSFMMTLSGEVPKTICQSLTDKPLFDKQPQTVSWAIHPGGKQIIDGIKNTTGIPESEVSASRKVLLENGNMSSATILFVLAEIIKNKPSGKKEIVACAFGPGLTLESALLSRV